MRPFDCLSPDCPLLGKHLLEASAGTGKTFAIEHIVTRLILSQEEFEVDRILAVTFTKAATRELKQRIQATLLLAKEQLETGEGIFPYLSSFLNDPKAKNRLVEACSRLDEVHVFTIHGFCFRMLQEFAFEAELSFSLSSPDEVAPIPDRIKRAAKTFLEEKLDPNLISMEQMRLLLKRFDREEELVQELLNSPEEEKALSFFEGWEGFLKALDTWEGASIELVPLLEDWQQLTKGAKKRKHALERQLALIVECFKEPSKEIFERFIQEKGTLFTFLKTTSKKETGSFHYPGFFSWVQQALGSFVLPCTDLKKILNLLKQTWQIQAKDLLKEEGYFSPDAILEEMQQAIQNPLFAGKVQAKYQAVILDEFQDTDPIQWAIFSSLFVEPKKLGALYLVGDPKQSIYRFRKADIYTYLKAKEELGADSFYCLDTNYRTYKPLCEALNALFARKWLRLPKTNSALECFPVKAGLSETPTFSDNKAALHFLVAEELSFEESLVPYAIQEIEKTVEEVVNFSSFAVLVKDRYQAKTLIEALEKRGIPVVAKSQALLKEEATFVALKELFEALYFPRDLAKRRLVEAGPFYTLCLEEARALFFKEGLPSFLAKILPSPLPETDRAMVEALLYFEAKEGKELSKILSFFEPFSEEASQLCPMKEASNAVQVLTMHMSKGLEFDVVFAFGLSTKTPENEETLEADAEKLRQLYVTMTRAKRRLYVPLETSEKAPKIGTASPMYLFQEILKEQEGSSLEFLEKLTQEKSVSMERVEVPLLLEEKMGAFAPPDSPQLASVSSCRQAPSSYLQSFTSLSQRHEKPKSTLKFDPGEEKSPHTLPLGKETGVLLHSIFEAIFSTNEPLWRSSQEIRKIIEQQLEYTPLADWISVVEEMVKTTLKLPLTLEGKPFCLSQLEPSEVHAEMELLFSFGKDYIKGFVDLIFQFEGKYYIVDWKSNWLGSSLESYQSLAEAMDGHDYWLQAKLYADGFYRHVKRFYKKPYDQVFGGALYFFLRGGQVCQFMPEIEGSL